MHSRAFFLIALTIFLYCFYLVIVSRHIPSPHMLFTHTVAACCLNNWYPPCLNILCPTFVLRMLSPHAASRYIEAFYTVTDPKTGEQVERRSLLLASGFWGVARHFHYVFELTAAWSWCLLANPVKNGVVPLFYATFLTILLLHRAKRDETKCQKK